MVRGAGSQFDPTVVEVFAAIAPDLPDLHASPSLG
jgi:response regulator RpfG family c-di-GMP phosphodiesterase